MDGSKATFLGKTKMLALDLGTQKCKGTFKHFHVLLSVTVKVVVQMAFPYSFTAQHL